MRSYVQEKWSSPEARGCIARRLMVGGNRVNVDKVTVPGPRDRQTRFRFFRAQSPAQAAVIDAWQRSEGTANYLGEWHTHPQDDPTPSSQDRRDWRRLVTMQQYEQKSLFFVIVGRRTMRAWELSRDAYEPIPLIELREDPANGSASP